MNLAFFARFKKNKTPLLKSYFETKSHPVFKGARFDAYLPSFSPDRMIILLGQMHTVLSGSISNRVRRNIVACQARLLSYYAYFENIHHITSFGGEGEVEGAFVGDDQKSFELYKNLEKKFMMKGPYSMETLPEVAQKILSELGVLWQEELQRKSDQKLVSNLAFAISGQTLFDYLRNGAIQSYPIEGEKPYQRVLQGITELGRVISNVENSYEMRVVRQRGGKAISDKESAVVKEYNSLVGQFNTLIKSDIRERATLEILREKSRAQPLMVFTMGVGHRKNYLRLVNEYFAESNTMFVFISAPELLLSWWKLIGIPLLILAVLFGIGYAL